jgi:hypothetical protein
MPTDRLKWDDIKTTQKPSNRPIGKISTFKWDVISEAPDGGEIRFHELISPLPVSC